MCSDGTWSCYDLRPLTHWLPALRNPPITYRIDEQRDTREAGGQPRTDDDEYS